MEKKYLTAMEVVEHLQIHIDTVYALAKKASLPGAKIGKQWRFDADEIHLWFSKQVHRHQMSSEDN